MLKYPDLGEEGFTQFTITGRVHNCMKSGLQTASHTTSKVKRLAEYGQALTETLSSKDAARVCQVDS